MGGMNDLPLDVSLDIFSRLHVNSVLDCKLVCKSWCKLIRNPSFAQVYLARHKLLLQKLHVKDIQDHSTNVCENLESGFLMLAAFNEFRVHYVEYSEDEKKKSYEIKNKTINIPIKQRSSSVLIGSCNGLICSSMRHHGLDDPIHICNPVTREYVYLPRHTGREKIGFPYGREFGDKIVSGFGYSPSTGEYKVVRIYHKEEACWFQVYILGNESCKWTEEKQIPYQMFDEVGQDTTGVFINGEIYWLDWRSRIVAFSLADEEFRFIASPPHVEGRSNLFKSKILFVLGDCLCLVDHIPGTMEKEDHFDVWVLRKNSDMNMQQNGTSNWSKEFTVQANTTVLIPFGFAKEGKVLFWQDDRLVSCYDPKTAVLEKLGKDVNGYKRWISFQATHHRNSFVSLKALGVKNCRRSLQYKGKCTE